MDGFNNLPCLDVKVTTKGLNGTVVKGNYGDFTIQNNASTSRVSYILLCSKREELTRGSVRSSVLRQQHV
jgi:hypothetical protein